MKRTDIILLLNLSLIPLFAGCSQNNIYRSANNGSELTYPELTNEQNAIIAPGPPGNLWFSIESGNKIINWQGTRDDTVSYYTIYGRCDKDSSLKKISQIKSIGDNSGMYSFNIENDSGCDYSISATSFYGAEGSKELLKTMK